jgi:hypothetical protein
MTLFSFAVTDVVAETYAVSPQLTAKLRIEEASGATIHAIALQCQVRIEPQRRTYSAEEEAGLVDLFGGRERWFDTLKPFMWMQTGTVVQGFNLSTEVDLPLPCTYDFEVAGSKYLHAMRDHEVPLSFLFSGTVFLRGGASNFTVERVPWNCEARHRMPVSVWRAMVDHYFPNSGWLRLDREALDALARYRSSLGLTGWDETVETLLARAQEPAS